MGYILKDTNALISTKLTDLGRQKMSQGRFNISYFQVGDSEVCYDCIPGAHINTGFVLEPNYPAWNNQTGEKNRSHVKYPLLYEQSGTTAWGIPFDSSYVDDIFNSASPRGFFNSLTGTTLAFTAFTSSAYTINSNWEAPFTNVVSGNTVVLTSDVINSLANSAVTVGMYMGIYFNNTSTTALTNNYPVLFYKVLGVTGNATSTSPITIEVDRDLPNFTSYSTGSGRVFFFPSGMTGLYDSYTPQPYWDTDVFNFESECDISQSDVKIWNMNIPWTESVAGTFSTQQKGYTEYGSTGFCGTKEYLGYNNVLGQTFQTSATTANTDTFYYNSLGDIVNVLPKEQKAISIIHYTNQSIDNFYGEKFATQPYDSLSPYSTGQAARIRVSIPTVMWHKTTGTTQMGLNLFVDPTGFTSQNLFQENYVTSSKNDNTYPGLRYYHLWDTFPNSTGKPNRVGKVFPDLQIFTIDDEELIAAMSYKSNRNWTLPAPKLGLVVPNTFNNTGGNTRGILSGSNESLFVTYRFDNSGETQSLHCNYYSKITGQSEDCGPDSNDVTIRFGNEFPYMHHTPTANLSGFVANNLIILAQRVTGDTRPDATAWREISAFPQISATTVGSYVTVSGLTATTLQVTNDMLTGGTIYNLNNYIDLPDANSTTGMTFGEEYFFYGNIDTDIQATIYVMNYLVNLGQNDFFTSTNPTWNASITNPYVTEVGLYDSDKNLMILSKIQSPQLRQGVQQYSIKFDF